MTLDPGYAAGQAGYTDPDGPYADDELCPTSHGHGCLDPDCPCECHAEYG